MPCNFHSQDEILTIRQGSNEQKKGNRESLARYDDHGQRFFSHAASCHETSLYRDTKSFQVPDHAAHYHTLLPAARRARRTLGMRARLSRDNPPIF